MRLVVISPSFFGYERAIVEAFRGLGHDAVFIDERPSNASVARAAVRIFPRLFRGSVNRHFRHALRTLGAAPIDGVLVIKGEVVPTWFLSGLKRLGPTAPFVYYTFDSLQNSRPSQPILPLFQHRFSFDPTDAAANPGFELKHLFYADSYRPGDAPRDLDVSFVGTLHGNRYAFTQAVSALISPERRKLYYYMPARWYLIARKLTSGQIRAVPTSEVSFTPLSRDEIVSISQRSRAVVDLQRSGQAGLTMRTFEVLATGAALITANESIRDLPFYSSERVLVVSRNPGEIDPEVVSDFVARQPDYGTPPDNFDKYSLTTWVRDFVDIFARSGGDGSAHRR